MARGIKGTELADLLGVTSRQVHNLVQKGLPRSSDGSYPAAEAIRWYVDWKAQQALPSDLLTARTRREAALAEQEELKLAEMRHQLCTVEQFKRCVDDAFSRVAAKLRVLPSRAAPQLVGCATEAEAFERIKREVDEVMRELYEAEDVPAEAAG